MQSLILLLVLGRKADTKKKKKILQQGRDTRKFLHLGSETKDLARGWEYFLIYMFM